MGALFSRSQPSRVTEIDKIILQLKLQRDKLRQYQKRQGMTIEKDLAIAKKLVQSGNHERAKLVLTRKRRIEKSVERTEGNLRVIEEFTEQIEDKQIQIRVLDCLRQGNEALRQLNKLFSLEDVEQILADTQEAKEKENEISALLTGTPGDDQVEDEYNSLVAEVIALPRVPVQTPSRPTVPASVDSESTEAALT